MGSRGVQEEGVRAEGPGDTAAVWGQPAPLPASQVQLVPSPIPRPRPGRGGGGGRRAVRSGSPTLPAPGRAGASRAGRKMALDARTWVSSVPIRMRNRRLRSFRAGCMSRGRLRRPGVRGALGARRPAAAWTRTRSRSAGSAAAPGRVPAPSAPGAGGARGLLRGASALHLLRVERLRGRRGGRPPLRPSSAPPPDGPAPAELGRAAGQPGCQKFAGKGRGRGGAGGPAHHAHARGWGGRRRGSRDRM